MHDNYLATPRITANAAQHPSIAIVDRDDLRAIGTHHHGASIIARANHTNIPRTDAEAIGIAVPDE